ncbi:hypothetical protein [Mycolicibacterium aromaticivorans]|uniref:hypothetical protein n=1 Tax=Mycolicibacterium aromaticivorans TaxID=318425 RepID=UPI0012FEB5D2|nr:hypothetical protein [Mycolicibacterium aromaticivorans]
MTTLSAITVFDDPCVVTAQHDADVATGDVTVPVIPAVTAPTQVMMNAPPRCPQLTDMSHFPPNPSWSLRGSRSVN